MPNRFLAVRSVPLAADTRDAWRQQDVVFRRRNRSKVWDTRFHEPHIEAVLNLGNLDMDFRDVPVPIFNSQELIRSISSPVALRRTLPDLVPSDQRNGPHWHKRNGYKGVGKVFHERFDYACNVLSGDVQKHIVGPEYRVITTGPHVVQAFLKAGTAPNFDYEWVGVAGIKTNGIIPLLHAALNQVPESQYSILGWDVIVGSNGPIIIECNTSPGVNAATAERIINVVKELI